MIERQIPGTPHPANTGVSYVPPARQADPPDRPYLAYQIDGQTLAERLAAPATPLADDGFSFNTEDLDAIATEWDKLGDTFALKNQKAQALLSVQGPGAEYASAIHAQAVNSTGNAMIAAFGNREQYCREQARKCRASANRYAQADSDSSRSLPKPDTPPAGSAL